MIYFYYNDRIPLYLLSIYGKNEKENLSAAERNELAKLTTLLAKSARREGGGERG